MALVFEGDPCGLALPVFSGGKLRHRGENALQSGRAKSCCFASPAALLLCMVVQSQSIPTQTPAPGSAPQPAPPERLQKSESVPIFLLSPSMCCRSPALRCQPGYSHPPPTSTLAQNLFPNPKSKSSHHRVAPSGLDQQHPKKRPTCKHQNR